jgi:SagB-type dehydrogenase family enzyme
VFTNYRTKTSASGSPETIRILHSLKEWSYQSELFAAYPEYSRASLREAVRLLRGLSLIVAEGTRASLEDERLEQVWTNWLPDCSFHFLTKNVEYLSTAETSQALRRCLEESPKPDLTKTYPNADYVELQKNTAPSDKFIDVLLSRRTHREFSGKRITANQVSNLLYYTWGVHGFVDGSPLGELFHKTSPSAGALHPGEVYLLAIRVTGLKAGLYHYDGLNHRLGWLRSVPAKKKAVVYTADHQFLKNASALFIMTAAFPRVQWKYRFARAYRVVLLDAGHLCQTFCLVASWLGLAPFCTAALRDTLIERDLGIDGITESVVYIAGVGVSLPRKMSTRR